MKPRSRLLYELELLLAQRLFVEGERCGASRPGAQRANEGIHLFVQTNAAGISLRTASRHGRDPVQNL